MARLRGSRSGIRTASFAYAIGVAAGCSSAGPSVADTSTGSGGQTGSSGGASNAEAGAPSAPEAGANSEGGGGPADSEGGAGPAHDAGSPDADVDADDGGEGDSAAAGGSVADDSSVPTGPVDYGGVGEEPLVPLAYTPQPVPPIIPMDCPGDPTQGFTEYEDSFVIQRPYDLAAADRFSYEAGIYTIWVYPDDKPHATWSNTKPRTEVRYSDMHTGAHLWTGDVMVESPSENVCIFQVKGALGPIGVYLRVNGGNVHQLGGADFLTGIYGKWFNLKVAWDSPTGTGQVWINNCLKQTVHGDANTIFYFKHGTYTCNSTICRDHFKNIHLYEKGSTDVYNVKSPIR